MDNNAMYCAEQINIPTELGPILKQFTKAVLLDEPQDLLKWSANYFAQLANLPLPFGANGEYLDGVGVAKKAKEEKGSAVQEVRPAEIPIEAESGDVDDAGNEAGADEVLSAIYAQYDE
eukprot:EG_transcript_46855